MDAPEERITKLSLKDYTNERLGMLWAEVLFLFFSSRKRTFIKGWEESNSVGFEKLKRI